MTLIACLTVMGIVSGIRLEHARAENVAPRRPATRGVPTGVAIFDRACGRCHPHGEEDIGPRIRNKNFDEARAVKQIRQGVGRMRPISLTKLPEANMPALIAYLRSIHTVR